MERKQRLGVILSTIGVCLILFGTTMAFFNYTRTGISNTVRVGKISFESEQTNTISLVDVFPIDQTEVGTSTHVGTGTITITGDTTYSDGVEYQLTVSNLTNTVGNKEIPIDLVITANGIGDSEDDYFTERGGDSSIYKVITNGTIRNNKQLLVGYIASGATGIDGTVTIKAYIDKNKIAISDTYDGTESNNMGTTTDWVGDRVVLTTTEWNNLQANGVSFQVKIEANEGIWVEEPLTSYEQIKRNVNTATQINFANASSSSNGQGLYLLAGTENDTNPIYYYRGAVDNNNVYFAGYCWQIVRTTETGGIKMIYNGLPDIEGSGNNVTYNCGTTRDIQDTIRTTTSLQQSTGFYYADDYEIVNTSGNSVTYKLKSKTNPITQIAIADATGAATNIPTIATNYPYTCKQTTDTATCTTLYKVDSYASGTNANVYSSLDRTIIERSAFNANFQSVSDVGYMSNTRYPYTSGAAASNSIFGKSVEWDETNSNYLVIEDIAGSASTNTTKDENHHYSCGTANTSSCPSVRYYYYDNYYIILTGGDTIEDALYKMTGTGSQETKIKNSAYNLNVNNSTAKTAIDNWFRTNLTSEVNSSNPDYSVYLEDTVYCNDRSFKTEGSSNTYTQSGWNPNGGSLSTYLYFGTHNRYRNSWYSTSNVPAVKNAGVVPNKACPNETDRFTVSSTVGNGALTYPVGVLTTDEIILAGVGGNNGSTSSYYLYTNDYYWSFSPYYFTNVSAYEFDTLSSRLDYNNVYNGNIGLRPVISLKLGTEFESNGDGTPTNPYVVKYN